MLEFEEKHQVSFDGCAIIAKIKEQNFWEGRGKIASFEEYTIVPVDHYQKIIGAARAVAKALRQHDHKESGCWECTLRKKLETAVKDEE